MKSETANQFFEPVAVYVHIPFCPSKCGYCDFNSFAMSGDIVSRTTDAIIAEVLSSPHRGRPAKTVFFGGGTPTYIPASDLIRLLRAILVVHPFHDEVEVTSEANPGTADAEKFAAMRAAGFNRISLGAQSFQSEDLVRLGRVHGATEVGRAVSLARSAGFENLNLDLMFALPGQNLSAWKQNLDLALALKPEHISLYGLTIEPNTRFYKLNQRGMLDLPTDEIQVEMYELAIRLTSERGFEQYEISNFARPGRQSQHNLCYWRTEEYLGYGPGAVGCFQAEGSRKRYTNIKHPERYCAAIESGLSLHCEMETLTPENLTFERLMLGIRLNEGVLESSVGSPQSLSKVLALGWVRRESNRLVLTNEGRHVCSAVIAELA